MGSDRPSTYEKSHTESGASPDRFGALLDLVTTHGDDLPRLSISAPFTGQRLIDLPLCGGDDVTLALERARKAQLDWKQRRVADRRRMLNRFADLLWKRRETVLDLMQLEAGKTRRDAFEEVADVLLNVVYYGKVATALLAARRLRPAVPVVSSASVMHHPVGVVGIIAPWNYPLTLAISDAVPALLAGNAVVLKPAEQTSLTALYVRLLLIEAGVPAQLFQVVTGRGEAIGPPLIDGIDFLQFTGSTAVGRVVGAQAGRRLIRTSLELGGKNPIIVFDDASPTPAVDAIIKGCFTNAGQLCISFERLYVQRGIYDRLLPLLIQRIHSMRISMSSGFDVDMGSLVSTEQLQKVEEHVADAREHGADVRTGGRRMPEVGPLFYAPTLLERVTPRCRAYAEETFGPVVSIYPFEGEEEAIRMANESEYGLNAAVWSGDVRRGQRVARHLECGTVAINDAYGSAWGAHGAPMGGRKSSGIGRRHGEEGLLKYTESQTISVQRGHPVAVSHVLDGTTFVRFVSAFIRAKRRIPFL